ncbi:29258_t:CDS:2, partial [Gigaspora margarita]
IRAEVPILTDNRSLVEVVKELSESKRTFDEFNPAIYLANIEELLTQETNPKDESLEQGLQKSVNTIHLNAKEQKDVFLLLYYKKDLFVCDINDLNQTSTVMYKIDTGSAALIKQLPY